MSDPSYAPPSVWEHYYTTKQQQNDDLNPEGMWAQAWLPTLARYSQFNRFLDLGCGTGGDALRLAAAGYTMTGFDYSRTALTRAAEKAKAQQLEVTWQEGDMAQPLPFADHTFDGVISNVAMHMFDDATTRRIVNEVQRVVVPHGLFCFHLNSTEDIPYRALRYVQVKELEPNFWREAHGQTMHFFDEDYLRDVLSDWQIVHLVHLPLQDAQTGEIFKCVWQGIAQNGAPHFL